MKILLLCLLFTLVNCAGPVEEKTKASITFAASASTDFPGGLFLQIYSKDLDLYHFKSVSDTNFDIELPNGNWTVSAIGWEGANPFTGDHKCDVKDVNLDGNEINLNLGLSQANCLNANFGLTERKTGNQAKPLTIIGCVTGAEGLPDVNDVPKGDDCADNPGKHRNFKILVHEFVGVSKSQMFSQKISSVESNCISAAANSNLINSTVKMAIPEGIPFSIATFNDSGSGCTSPSTVVHFEKGMNNGNPNNTSSGFVKNGDNSTDVYILAGICTDTYATDPSPSDFGITSGPTYICNETQFGAINTNPAGNYYIAADIDFGNDSIGGNNSITTIFSGKLDGGGHILSNFNDTDGEGLIKQLSGNAELQDFTVSNFTVDNSTATYAKLGLLVRGIVASGGTNNISIEDIKIKDSNLISSFNPPISTDTTGLLIGGVDLSTGERLDIRNIQISGSTIHVKQNDTYNIGLLIGYAKSLDDPHSMQFSKIDIENSEVLLDDTVSVLEATQAGGVIGSLENGMISNSSLKDITIEGSTEVGGLVGKLNQSAQLTNNSLENIELVATSSLTPAPSNNISFGGLVGKSDQPTAPSDIKMSNNLLKGISIFSKVPSVFLENVGGIIGDINNLATTSITISNNKVTLKVIADGNYHAGVLGQTTAGGIVQIKDNIAYAHLLQEDNSLDSNFKAGVVSVFMPTDASSIVEGNIIFTKIDGTNNLAGLVSSTNKNIKFNRAEIEINMDNNLGSSETLIAGGLVAELYSPGDLSFNKILGSINIPNYDITCDKTAGSFAAITNFTDNCGDFVGVEGGGSISENLAVIPIIHPENPLPGTLTIPGTNNITDETSGSLTILPGTYNWEFSNGTYDLSNFKSLERMNAINLNGFQLDDVTYDNIKIGNPLEPIQLASVNDWNEVGNNEFLLRKSYELVNDIDFSAANLIPFGGAGSDTPIAFSGSLQSNGYTLRNITLNSSSIGAIAASEPFGIIRHTQGTEQEVRIGSEDSPLLVDNIIIDLAGVPAPNNIGSIVGEASNTEITARVTNAIITTNSSGVAPSVGGLVGKQIGPSHLRISNSLFDGEIDYQNGPSACNLGGLIGHAQISSNSRIELENNKVSTSKLTKQSGGGFLGGFIGLLNLSAPGAEAKIISNYVDFKDDTSGSGAIILPLGSTSSAFIGSYSDASSGGSTLESNFTDIRKLTTVLSTPNNFIGNGSDPGIHATNAVISSLGGTAPVFLNPTTMFSDPNSITSTNDHRFVLIPASDPALSQVKLFWE